MNHPIPTTTQPVAPDRQPVVRRRAVPTAPRDLDEHWRRPTPRPRPRSLFYRSLTEALRATSTSTPLRA